MMSPLFEAKLSGVAAIGLAGASAFFAMTDAVAISIVTSVSAVLMAAVSAYFAFLAKSVSEKTHEAVNSRMTQLLEIAKKSSKSEGVLQEKKDQAQRQSKIRTKKAKPNEK